jgi:endonuclease/exonuclease/phosphatase family metal-dependent hydrolase
MTLRIATFNVENLFTRPQAMAPGTGEVGQNAIDHHAELNRIISKAVYDATDKARLLELDAVYGFSALNTPANALVLLNKIRGQLFSRSQAGVVTVVATGRADWTGWFSLRTGDVSWEAIYNTGRVVAEVDAHIQVCVEVENRPTLQRFNEQVLGAKFNKAFPHVMLVDGNDERGIDVGILSRYPIRSITSHVDDLNPNGERTFSRDCPEYVIDLPGGRKILVLPNHFKSKRGGNTPAMQARRKAQADRAHAIAAAALTHTQLVLIAGDLNDTPGEPLFASLWQDGFVDVADHLSYPTDRPGTFDTGTAANKIDYLIMSPKLRAKLTHTGIERRGSYHPHTWVPFDTVTKKADEASDHQLVWADFSL